MCRRRKDTMRAKYCKKIVILEANEMSYPESSKLNL